MTKKRRLLASAALLLIGLNVQTAGAQDSASVRSPFDKAVRVADYLEPAIPMPEQEQAAQAKLDALRAKTGRPPNILIILVDDMGWGDVGVNGGGDAVGAPTPNIDRLAHEGLNLTSTYSQSLCTPSRAALMTGRLPARTGLTRPLLTGENPKVNPWAGEDTAAKLLGEAGYRTALSGKWHLGEAENTRPHEVGYDEYLGILSVTSELSQALDSRIYPDLVNKPERMDALRKISHADVTAGEKGGPTRVVKSLQTTDDLGSIDQMFADFSVDLHQA